MVTYMEYCAFIATALTHNLIKKEATQYGILGPLECGFFVFSREIVVLSHTKKKEVLRKEV